MNIELIRHGETALQARGCYQGRLDEPLSEAGKRALQPAGRVVSTVYVTPLRRTAETAAILFPGARQVVIPDLREMDFGAFEGRNYREMEQDADYRAWVDGFCRGRCPGGECREEFCDRVCRAFEALVRQMLAQNEKELVIVAHGGTQMAVMERFALPRRPYFDWHAASGQGYVLETTNRFPAKRLRLVGQTDYTRNTKEGRT